jgi:hypothetical protein
LEKETCCVYFDVIHTFYNCLYWRIPQEFIGFKLFYTKLLHSEDIATGHSLIQLHVAHFFVLFVNSCLLFSPLVITTWNYDVVLPSEVILPLGFTPILCFNNYYGYFWILFVLSSTNILYLISLF